jgi:hypothetical protein
VSRPGIAPNPVISSRHGSEGTGRGRAPAVDVQSARLRDGDKVDFWLLKDEPFDRERFARRLEVEAMGQRLSVSTPEDTILMKLRWAMQSGGSEKQVGDAAGVFAFQGDLLDQAYLDRWAEALGVSALLADLRARVGGGGPGLAGEAPPA